LTKVKIILNYIHRSITTPSKTGSTAMNHEEAVWTLATALEIGKEKVEEGGGEFLDYLEEAREVLGDEVSSIPEIRFGARLCLLLRTKSGPQRLEQFVTAVIEIIPEQKYVEELVVATVREFREGRNDEPVVREKEFEEYRKRQSQFISKILGKSEPIPIRPRRKERRKTHTELVPCPDCGLEKRCDAKTKNFRCKCGFESPFPLEKTHR